MLSKLTLVDVLLVAVLLAASITAQMFAPGAVGSVTTVIAVLVAYLKQGTPDAGKPGDA